MGMILRDVRIFVMHEPLWPVTSIHILTTECLQQNATRQTVMLLRDKIFKRPLAGITRAPCGPRILLQSVWRGIMNQRIVRIPTQRITQARHRLHITRKIKATIKISPVIRICSSPLSLQLVHHSGPTQQRSDNRQFDRLRRRRLQDQHPIAPC